MFTHTIADADLQCWAEQQIYSEISSGAVIPERDKRYPTLWQYLVVQAGITLVLVAVAIFAVWAPRNLAAPAPAPMPGFRLISH